MSSCPHCWSDQVLPCSPGTALSPFLLLRPLSPFVSRMIILDAALHVLQLIQDSKHVDELAQSEEISLRHEVLPPLSVAQALHLAAEPLDGLALQGRAQGQAHHGNPPTRSFKKAFLGWGWRFQGSSLLQITADKCSVLEGRKGLEHSNCTCPKCGVFCKTRLHFSRGT